jgi:hypothetical protein
VLLALDPSRDGDPTCVIKRLPAEVRGAADVRTRFRRAAHLVRRLSHETLVTTLAVGEFEGEPYLVQEFVEGHDLGTVLERCEAERRRMPVDAAVFVAREISRALDYVHGFEGLGLVHRHVCPSRIRLGYEGQAKLLEQDLDRSTALAEKPCSYIAPEQVALQPVDGRADLYALGAVLWEVLTGRPLASVERPGEPHAADAPSAFNGEIPAELDQVVLRLLARAPDSRWSSAREVESALAALQMPRGQESLAALMSRLFDAQAERKRRSALLSSARKAVPAGATQLVVVNPAAATEERELPRMPRNEPPATEAPRVPAAAPTQKPVEPRENPATRSVTLHLRATGPWWRRFFLFFGFALVAAVLFNRYMSGRLQAEWRAEDRAAANTTLIPPPPANQTPPVPAPQVAKVDPVSANADAAPAPNRPSLPVHAAIAPDPSTADARPRPLAPADPPSRGVSSLERARAAFEHDEFAKAVELGQAALGAGDRRAHAVLGAAYFKLGRYREAERSYNDAAQVEPDNTIFRKRAESAHRMAEGHSDATAP